VVPFEDIDERSGSEGLARVADPVEHLPVSVDHPGGIAVAVKRHATVDPRNGLLPRETA